MKRHYIRAFKLDEISAVDRPAQEHALATILKRDTREAEDELMRYEKHISGPTSFGAAVDRYRAQGFAGTEAMHLAATRHPDLLAKYQQGEAPPEPEPVPVSKAGLAWDSLVDSIAKDDGVPRSEAMRRARREHPAVFKAFQES